MRALETSDPIELSVTATEPVTIRHGLGRQVKGWLVIWRSAPGGLVVGEAGGGTRPGMGLAPASAGAGRHPFI